MRERKIENLGVDPVLGEDLRERSDGLPRELLTPPARKDHLLELLRLGQIWDCWKTVSVPLLIEAIVLSPIVAIVHSLIEQILWLRMISFYRSANHDRMQF